MDRRGQGEQRQGRFIRRRWRRGSSRRWTSDDPWNRYNGAESSFRSRERTAPSTSSTSSSSSSSGATSDVPELPGFYFDREKNRYFRLLPGHNNCNPLTKEQLQAKEREKKRSMMLLEDDTLRKKAPRPGCNSTLLHKQTQLGLVSEKSFCRWIHEVRASTMRRHKLNLQTSDNSSPDKDNFRFIMADSKCEQLFTVNDSSHGGCKYGLMKLGASQSSLSLELCDSFYFTNHTVNSTCWASINYTDSHVLLCFVGAADTPGCVSLLPASLFRTSHTEAPGRQCSLKICSAWSCAWCNNPFMSNTVSIGLSRKVILKNAVSGETRTFKVNTDVLTQQFALHEPLLYNGCRSGEIFSIDLRLRGSRSENWKASSFHQESAITSLRVLEDENYVMAADMLGQIKLWDVRKTKPVMEYAGHYNEHAHLPIHISEPEGLLLAVGQDCNTRIWSLKDARLLRTIPSPHPVSNNLIPSIIFSSNLGGSRGLTGLLMAVESDLYFYPYNSDEQDVSR
ncbi:WD repeat domain 21 [Synchiropus picturatus]